MDKPEHFKPFVKLCLALSKIVHEQCKDVPHDIGLTLGKEVERHIKKKDRLRRSY